MKSKNIWILTLFPEYFTPLFNCGVVGKSLENLSDRLEVKIINIRDFALNRYKSVDDYPYGGAPGMIMRADVLKNALWQGVVVPGGYSEDYKLLKRQLHVVFPSPRGKKWNSTQCRLMASRISGNLSQDEEKDLVFLCGRYEGIDERFIQRYVDEEISLGDFILSGGEPATLAILDSALRFVEGTLGNQDSLLNESFENSLLEAPQYTRPREFEGLEVPPVLISGHHQAISDYNREQSEALTEKYRPDLFDLDKKNK